MVKTLESPVPPPPALAFPSNYQRLERNLVVVFSLVPFLALGIAIPLLWRRGISGADLGIMLGFYLFTGIGITVGFHRHFTHKSFRAHPAVRTVMAVAGSMAIEGPIVGWVADHRRHHQFSDQPGDPHSPHLEEAEGWRGALKGLWHAHMGWLLLAEKTLEERFAPDLLKDRVIVWIDRWFAGFVTLSLILPAVLGYALTGTWWGAFTAFLWGSLVRVFVLHHVTYSINSICHYFGAQPYESKDESRNNWILALPSFGESWHNNHHAFPSSAVHGIGRGQVDPGAWVIRGLERLGLVEDVKLPAHRARERKRRS